MQATSEKTPPAPIMAETADAREPTDDERRATLVEMAEATDRAAGIVPATPRPVPSPTVPIETRYKRDPATCPVGTPIERLTRIQAVPGTDGTPRELDTELYERTGETTADGRPIYRPHECQECRAVMAQARPMQPARPGAFETVEARAARHGTGPTADTPPVGSHLP